jgi:cell division septation protein DedD
MATNEEGEFELILGNKQLLSVFFVVIILLGVFFTMGYIVGRNSSPVTAAVGTGSDPSSSARTPSAMGSVKTAEQAPSPVTETSPQQPAAEASAPVGASRQAESRPLEIPPVVQNMREPQPGQLYVQVLAVPRAEADVLADVLRKKGMATLVAAGPNERLFRVLVGPVKDAAEAVKVKSDLEQAGFRDAFPKRY